MGDRLTHLRADGWTVPVFTPVRAAIAAAAAIGVARLVAAFALQGPSLMPDEYLYTAIARSVAHGGWPTVRGGHLDFIPVLASVLTAPAWLVHDVEVGYRLAQAEGVVAMTLAAVPAFALSRRVGLSDRSAAVAAVFAVLVPDVGMSGLLLSEPFAYPLFLLTILFAVETFRAPSLRADALFLAAAGALCLTRLQFAFVPLVYLATVVVVARPFRLSTVLASLRSHRLVAAAVVAATAVVAAVGVHVAIGRYAGLESFGHQPRTVLHWTTSNLILLLVAAGWVTAPGALLGLGHDVRRGDPAARGFASLTVLATAAVVGEAGVFGAGLGQLEERYTFYAAPLLMIAFLVAFERRLLASRAHAVLAGALAAVALFLPLDDPLFTGLRGQSPVLVAFQVVQRHAQWRAPILAGAFLLALALAALALGRRGSPRSLVGLAVALVVVVGMGYAAVLVPATAGASRAAWQVDATGGSASFLAFPGVTVPNELTTALFWNPGITRVLVLGGRSVDSFASRRVSLAPGGRLVTADGPVRGPVVFQSHLAAIHGTGAPIERRGTFGLITDAGRVRIAEMLVGWYGAIGALAPNGSITVVADRPQEHVSRTVRLRLRALRDLPDQEVVPTRIRFRCSSGVTRTVTISAVTRTVTLPLEGRGVAACRFGLVSGRIHWHEGFAETVEGQVALGASSMGLKPSR